MHHANVKANLIAKQCNSDQWWNSNKSWCDCKKRHVCEQDYVWNPATCSCENGKYLANIMDDSAVTCDKIIEPYDEETENILTNFNDKKAICKKQNFYILLAFLLITIVLLIAVSIYCYLIKYQAKQNRLLPFHFTNNELREFLYW